MSGEYDKLSMKIGWGLQRIILQENINLRKLSYHFGATGTPGKKKINIFFVGDYHHENANIIKGKLAKIGHSLLRHPKAEPPNCVLTGVTKKDLNKMDIEISANEFDTLWGLIPKSALYSQKNSRPHENSPPNRVTQKKSTPNPRNITHMIIHIMNGMAIVSTAAIFSIALAAAVGATVSGTVAAKIGLVALSTALAANPIGAIAIASGAGVAFVGMLGLTLYKGYQAYNSTKVNKSTPYFSYAVYDAADNDNVFDTFTTPATRYQDAAQFPRKPR